MDTPIDQHEHEPAESADRGLSAAAAVASGEIEPPRDGEELTPDESRVVEDATNWLLEAFDASPDVTKTLDLNVGSTQSPKWVKWTIRAVEGPTLRRIRARAAESITRNARSKAGALGDADAAFRANVEVVVEGTVEPDVRGLARGRGLADPSVLVEEAFRVKQGLIDQVAGEIMSLSGYDDDDVRDSLELEAAGNS